MMVKFKIRRLIIRVPKQTANLIYYLLESHEGLLFHSTLDNNDPHSHFREIEIMGSVTLENEIMHLVGEMKNQTTLEILEDHYIE